MQSKAKTNSVIVTSLVEGNPTWTVLGVEKPITLHLDRVAQSMRERAEVHGWFQHGSDGAARSRDATTGKPASAQDKYDSILELVNHYETGTEEWAMRSGGGGGTSITLQAVARVRGCTYEEAEASVARYAESHYKGDTKAALAFFRTGAKVGEAIIAIRGANQPKPAID